MQFIVRPLQEKYFAKKKDLCMAFVDLEIACLVSREVVWCSDAVKAKILRLRPGPTRPRPMPRPGP